KLFGISELAVRIEIIDQAERNVDHRHLNAKLQTDAGAKIADLAECRVRNTKKRILLNLTTKEKLLNLRRKARRATKPVAAAEFVDIVGLRHDSSAIVKKAAEAAFQNRRIYQPESGQSFAA